MEEKQAPYDWSVSCEPPGFRIEFFPSVVALKLCELEVQVLTVVAYVPEARKARDIREGTYPESFLFQI